MKIWSDSRLNQTVENCLNNVKFFLQEKEISVEIQKHHTYRFRVADRLYVQDYFERIGYSPQGAETLASITNALTIHEEKIIVVREKHIQDYNTILHELLHSLTWMRKQYKRWVREGLTQYIQKQIASRFKQETKKSLYDELGYTKIWETVARIVGEKTILLLYFSESEKILKLTTKEFEKAGINLPEWLQADFSQAKSFLKKDTKPNPAAE